MLDDGVNFKDNSAGDLNSQFLPNSTELTKMWWEYEGFSGENHDKILQNVLKRAENFISDMQPFYNLAYEYTKLYEEHDYQSSTDRFNRINKSQKSGKSYNLIRIAVDAHYNRIAKVAPKVTCLSKDADQTIKRHASFIDDFIFNQFKKGGIYEQAPMAQRDGIVANLGILKMMFDRKKKRFKFKRVIPYCFAVEDPLNGSDYRSECVEYSMFKVYDLIRLYESAGAKTSKNKMLKDTYENVLKLNKDESVKVYEMYKTENKKIIFSKYGIIAFIDWKYDWLPYRQMVWDKKALGFIGTGVTEIAYPAQRKINALLRKIDKNTNLFTNQYMILPAGSQFKQKDNGFGRFYEANMMGGVMQKPIHVTPPVIHEQVFNQVDKTFDKGLQVTRVSQLQSEGRIPTGLNQGSGKALKHYNDIDTSRFFVNLKLYEGVFIGFAQNMFEMACDVVQDEKWKEIKEKKTEIENQIQKFPESLFPESPSGKLTTVTQMYKDQLIDQSEALELLDYPDTTGFLRMKNSRVRAISKIIQTHMDKGLPIPVDPLLDYTTQRKVAMDIYTKMVYDSPLGIDDKKLLPLMKYLKEVIAHIEQKKIEQARFAAQNSGAGEGKGFDLPQPPQQPGNLDTSDVPTQNDV